MVTAASVDSTEVFRITASSSDPAEAKLIVDTIVDILPNRIADIVDGSSVSVVKFTQYIPLPGQHTTVQQSHGMPCPSSRTTPAQYRDTGSHF